MEPSMMKNHSRRHLPYRREGERLIVLAAALERRGVHRLAGEARALHDARNTAEGGPRGIRQFVQACDLAAGLRAAQQSRTPRLDLLDAAQEKKMHRLAIAAVGCQRIGFG